METEGEISAARRALLQRYLRGAQRPNETKPATIPKRTGSAPAPFSWNQQQIWLHAQVAGDAPIYNEPITLRRRGALNIDALERAFTEIVRRHEAWRTTFEWRDDRGIQIVQPPPDRISIPRVDLTDAPNAEAEALRLATEDARKPFDLARGPMYRLLLVSLGREDHRLFVTLHHIIFDGVSLYRVFLPELIAAYESFAKNETPALPDLPIQYPDFAAWQRETMREIAPADREFWERTCADLPTLDLPTDRPHPPSQSYNGATVRFEIPAATTAALKAMSQEQNATPFIVMVAAFMTLLRDWSGQEEIVLGGISSGRHQLETLGLLGCFLNTVPIRARLSDNLRFDEILARVRRATLDALSHDQVPFELLVQNFATTRDRRRAPLVQALIVVEPPLEPLPAGWSFTHMDVDTGTAKFDLQLGLDDRAEGLAARFTYNTDLFNRATIEDLCVRWLQLLERIIEEPARVPGRAEARPSGGTCSRMSSPARDRAEVSEMPPAIWNETRTNYPRDAAIHQLFEEQTARTPSAIALVSREIQLTYDQLNRRANQLARVLQKRGVTSDQPVGVCLERSPEMIIALLAILKAGGAYVPLDPAYPPERLQWMIADTAARLVLTESDLREESGREDDRNLENQNQADDLAYIIYTSGSTGQPKGVAIPHRGVVRLVRETNYASFSPNETFLQLAPISFDASTFEIWGALLNGARLVLMPPAAPSLEEIGRTIREHGVTTLWLTSALFNAMVDERLEDLRPLHQLLAGGDVLSTAHVQKAIRGLTNTHLINGYGPTESTTFACCYRIPAQIEGAIPIGSPIANTTAQIFDADLRPVAIGVTGELYLGGDGLARSYWRRPELTAEKFIEHPTAGRLYKSGDLARWRADGVIEFLGRADNQVKLRGFRIEPGEIEAVLKKQPTVRDAAVILRETSPNEKSLVGYVVGNEGAFDEAALFAALRTVLPDFMIPAALVSLGEMPRTPNGKLDRAALPAPASSETFVAPRGPLEEQLAAIWAEVLGVERVGAHDNFFDLGGHSLTGLRLVNQVREKIGARLAVAVIFEAPTVAAMAKLLGGKTSADSTNIEARPLAPIVPVNRETRRARRA